MREGNNK